MSCEGGCTSCGVRFRPAGRLHTALVEGLELAVGDRVVVQLDRGPTIGRVVSVRRGSGRGGPAASTRVLRLAGDQDLARDQRNEQKARDAERLCREKIRARRLDRDVKVVQAKFGLDPGKLQVLYTSERKADLREVATELSTELRANVEMTPIGPRDAVGIIGAVGPCGLQTCCSTFLDEFHPVSVKMAKAQSLSLNEPRLTGMCGRLKCCLAYEYDLYRDLRKRMPRVGKKIEIEEGRGKVIGHNVLGGTVTVLLETGERVEHRVAPADTIEAVVQEEGAEGDAPRAPRSRRRRQRRPGEAVLPVAPGRERDDDLWREN